MTVRVERSGPVTTVVLDRPEVRNAVDGPTAEALADAFRAFDADPEHAVAVLYGAGGTFCAGADLKAVGGRRGNRVEADGRRPDGARPGCGSSQAGDRRDRGARGRRRAGAGALVRPAGRRGGRRARRLLPPLGRAADRRRHRPAAPADRHQPRDGPDPHRPPGRRRRGASDRPGQPGGAAAARRAPRPRRWRRRSPRSRRPACATTGSRPSSRRGAPSTRRWRGSTTTGSAPWRPVRSTARPGSPPGRGGTGRSGSERLGQRGGRRQTATRDSGPSSRKTSQPRSKLTTARRPCARRMIADPGISECRKPSVLHR